MSAPEETKPDVKEEAKDSPSDVERMVKSHTSQVLKPMLRKWRKQLKRVDLRSLYYGRIITAVYHDDMTAFSHWLETSYIKNNSQIDNVGDTRARIESLYDRPAKTGRRQRERAVRARVAIQDEIASEASEFGEYES
ncbi:hypothetical protein J8273_1421 [Carpediemonas membranifera]|uniref:Uncharacterized protein n=1 Tax=Carpediemonas membranifera TaxID=201153 RepID=A0A8J6BB54_9EUKA|nr:hypothetical protein J8273_1421 [Carpediemonas membranifera]|eukprot:KAG9397064.1 hypothetical protein J8273_1421 [Carpediemonas membranifera]